MAVAQILFQAYMWENFRIASIAVPRFRADVCRASAQAQLFWLVRSSFD